MEENQENVLIKIFISKCTAHVKYRYYSLKAKEEGFFSVAETLGGFAKSELNQAFALLKRLGYDDTTEINLTDTVNGARMDVERTQKAEESVEDKALLSSVLKMEQSHLKTAERLLDDMKSEDAYKLKKCALCGKTDKSGRIGTCCFCGYNVFV